MLVLREIPFVLRLSLRRCTCWRGLNGCACATDRNPTRRCRSGDRRGVARTFTGCGRRRQRARRRQVPEPRLTRRTTDRTGQNSDRSSVTYGITGYTLIEAPWRLQKITHQYNWYLNITLFMFITRLTLFTTKNYLITLKYIRGHLKSFRTF